MAFSLDTILTEGSRTPKVSLNTCLDTLSPVLIISDAFTQMYNEPQLYGFLSLTLISIAFFNFSGVSITKYMSATTRKVLDTLRTMFIWVAQMLLHFADERWDMPSFKDQFWLQLAGTGKC